MQTSRRQFLTSISMLAASTAVLLNAFSFGSKEKLKVASVNQAELHTQEMEQTGKTDIHQEPIIVHKL